MFFNHLFQQKEYLKKNRLFLVLFVVLGIIKNASSFLLSVSIGEFFSIKFHSNGSKGKLLEMFGLKLHTLNVFFIFFMSLIFIRVLLEYFENFIISIQGEKFVFFVRKNIFLQQISWSQETFRSRHFSNYLLRYSNDMKAVQNYLTKGVMGGLKDFIFIVMGLILLSVINSRLSLYYASMITVSIGIVVLLSRRQRQLVSQSRSKRSSLLSIVTRSFQKHRKIKEEGGEHLVIDKYNDASQSLYEANVNNHQFESILFSLFSFLQFFMIAIVLFVMGADETIHIHHSKALVFILIIMLMNTHLKRVLKVPAIINKGIVSFQKIEKILKQEES